MRGRLVGALAAAWLAASGCSLPPVDLVEQRPLALRTTIRAADGTKLARLFKQNRALVPLDQVPVAMRAAVLAAEDARFFAHPGYDLRSIARAALVNLQEGEVVQGGSTITQQYVKNTFFRHPARDLERKARELRLAIEVERSLSKEQILERYLNTVYFGAGAYGIKSAAETFFAHGVARLTLPESALLASLIKSPTLYDPYGHPKQALRRRDYILDRMAELGSAGTGAVRTARRSPLGIVQDPPLSATRQPYFVEAVKRELLGEPALGSSGPERAKEIWEGGLQVDTTLEPELQAAAEKAAGSILNQPGDPEAALVAIRPQTGEIVAMVGGRDWSSSQVNLALGTEGGGSGRQPGSAFKPIVAATALESGIPLDARYESSPATFILPGGEPWVVRNSEGADYGLLPLDEAMVRSVNGVYARLTLQVGASQIVNQAHLMGVQATIPPYPSIALGGSEVSVLDMATAYATLANGGTAIEPTTIRSVRLAGGESFESEREMVPGTVSAGNAYLLTKVLEQVIERGTGVAADIGRPAAGKTGTTNDYTDAWFVGYTPDLVTAVWVGHPEGTIPMTSVHGIPVSGGTFPAQIWRAFMLRALRGEPVQGFEIPKGELVTVTIDPNTDLLAAPWCPGETRRMLRQLAPTEYCPAPPPPEPEPLVTPEPSPSPDAGKARSGKDKGAGDGAPKPDPKPSPKPEPSPEPQPSPGKD